MKCPACQYPMNNKLGIISVNNSQYITTLFCNNNVCIANYTVAPVPFIKFISDKKSNPLKWECFEYNIVTYINKFPFFLEGYKDFEENYTYIYSVDPVFHLLKKSCFLSIDFLDKDLPLALISLVDQAAKLTVLL